MDPCCVAHIRHFGLAAANRCIKPENKDGGSRRRGSRKASAIEEAEEALLNRKKTTAKDEIMRHFEIQLEDRSRSEHLQEYFVDRRKYRKKIKREISEYERLREHMQRFKNAKPNLTRASSRAGADLSASPSKKNKRSKDRYLFKSGRKS